MGLNYIGSKHSLLGFITSAVDEISGELGLDPTQSTFCDLFAGTGAVGANFKRRGWRIIANDTQTYSRVRLGALLLNDAPPSFESLVRVDDTLRAVSARPPSERGRALLAHLDQLEGADGYIYSNYCAGGTESSEHTRRYFSDENGRRADAIREQIATWSRAGLLSEAEEDYLLTALIDAVDRVANTASVYGAFLKKLKASARKRMQLLPPEIARAAPGLPTRSHRVYQRDAVELIGEISGDVLYLDPPYNQRQYAANYHLLETIARWDKPTPRGVTGLRDWSDQKSLWCSRKTVAGELGRLLERSRFRAVLLSYNDEGLLSTAEIEEILSRHGDYSLRTTDYGRFRADRDGAGRNYKREQTVEQLHCLLVG